MNDDDFKLNIQPPLFLASTTIECWRCGTDMPVACLIAPNIEGLENEIYVLCYVTKLPGDVLNFINRYFPYYKLTFSGTAQSKYYANTCHKCGTLWGDWYLHCEPGIAFFLQTEEDATRFILQEIPIHEKIVIEAEYHIGSGDFILENAARDFEEKTEMFFDRSQ
jgi:hypothetical protein